MHKQDYESNELLYQYLLFHYGQDHEILPHAQGPQSALRFPTRCLSEMIDLKALPPQTQALDVGCAVGRSSFELSRYCQHVTAIDYSQSFIQAAQTIQQNDTLSYLRHEEGHHYSPLQAQLPEHSHPERIHFQQGDATQLDPELGPFELVLAANLICRLPQPMQFLQRLPQLVKSGGQLIITTPSTWMEQYTPPEKWLDHQQESSFDGLHQALHTHFELVKTQDIPFLIREHHRKYQWSVAQGSLWLRKNTQ